MGIAKRLLKRLAQRVAPHAFETLQVIRARRHQQRLQAGMGLTRLNCLFVARYGAVVRAGTFQGMNFLEQGVWAGLVPKLLGSYEFELAPALDRLLQYRYERVVDVGCADGYYAVGLARRLPDATVFAYDLDPACRAACRRVGELNAIGDRLRVCGRCTHEELRDVLVAPRSLVVSDCEGFEAHLLDPAAVPALSTADLVVEFHRPEGGTESTESVVVRRLSATHDVQIFHPQRRDAFQFPDLEFLVPHERERLIAEVRPADQSFGVFTARRPQA